MPGAFMADLAMVGANAVVLRDAPGCHVVTGTDGAVRPDRRSFWLETE